MAHFYVLSAHPFSPSSLLILSPQPRRVSETVAAPLRINTNTSRTRSSTISNDAFSPIFPFGSATSISTQNSFPVPDESPQIVKGYLLGKELGRGAFGRVREATLLENPSARFAVKIIGSTRASSYTTVSSYTTLHDGIITPASNAMSSSYTTPNTATSSYTPYSATSSLVTQPFSSVPSLANSSESRPTQQATRSSHLFSPLGSFSSLSNLPTSSPGPSGMTSAIMGHSKTDQIPSPSNRAVNEGSGRGPMSPTSPASSISSRRPKRISPSVSTRSPAEEVALWSSIERHPHVLELLDTYTEGPLMYLFMPYCGHNLLTYLQNSAVTPEAALSPPEIREIFHQIASGLAHIHRSGIVHRDIKLENIVGCSPSDSARIIWKISDFGLAEYISQDTGEAAVAQGSLPYTAPEQVTSAGTLRLPAVDVYAMGCVLYAMVCGELPFSDDFEPRLRAHIVQAKYEIPAILEDPENADLLAVVRGCLEANPALRWTTDEILKSDWLSASVRGASAAPGALLAEKDSKKTQWKSNTPVEQGVQLFDGSAVGVRETDSLRDVHGIMSSNQSAPPPPVAKLSDQPIFATDTNISAKLSLRPWEHIADIFTSSQSTPRNERTMEDLSGRHSTSTQLEKTTGELHLPFSKAGYMLSDEPHDRKHVGHVERAPRTKGGRASAHRDLDNNLKQTPDKLSDKTRSDQNQKKVVKTRSFPLDAGHFKSSYTLSDKMVVGEARAKSRSGSIPSDETRKPSYSRRPSGHRFGHAERESERQANTSVSLIPASSDDDERLEMPRSRSRYSRSYSREKSQNSVWPRRSISQAPGNSTARVANTSGIRPMEVNERVGRPRLREHHYSPHTSESFQFSANSPHYNATAHSHSHSSYSHSRSRLRSASRGSATTITTENSIAPGTPGKSMASVAEVDSELVVQTGT